MVFIVVLHPFEPLLRQQQQQQQQYCSSSSQQSAVLLPACSSCPAVSLCVVVILLPCRGILYCCLGITVVFVLLIVVILEVLRSRTLSPPSTNWILNASMYVPYPGAVVGYPCFCPLTARNWKIYIVYEVCTYRISVYTLRICTYMFKCIHISKYSMRLRGCTNHLLSLAS